MSDEFEEPEESEEPGEDFDLEMQEPDAPAPRDMAALVRVAEALLFASAEPLDEASLRNRLPVDTDLEEILSTLAGHYDGRGVNLIRVGRGWAFRTAPDLASVMRLNVTVKRKLSRAAVETMSIIAYHQPVTRAEVEEIRGVALSRGTLDTLLEAGWIQPRGRRKVPGRPLQWGTTDSFLDHFGLETLAALPGLDDLKAAGLLDRRPGLTSIAMQEIEEDDEGEGGDDQDDLFPLDPDEADGEDSEPSDTDTRD
jgi:segregation and condensation protein B